MIFKHILMNTTTFFSEALLSETKKKKLGEKHIIHFMGLSVVFYFNSNIYLCRSLDGYTHTYKNPPSLYS